MSAQAVDSADSSACCGPAPADAACCEPAPAADEAQACCSPAPEKSAASYHGTMGELLDRFDVNDYAASVKIWAVKP